MFLALPSLEYKDSYIEALKEFRLEHHEQEAQYLERAEKDADKLVRHLLGHSQGLGLPEGHVPQTTFWLIDNGEYIGETRIRHYLNENLRKVNGHIGYSIRPSKRRQGYGKSILKLALAKAKELGIEKALLTCDASNIGSKKIIEAAGGIFDSEGPGDNGPKLKYWVPT